MALLFSAVTATSDSHQADFLVSGIPTCMEDLEDWTAFQKQCFPTVGWTGPS